MNEIKKVMEWVNKLFLFVNKQPVIVLTLVFFAVIFAFFSFVYVASPGEPRIDDHYFNVKFAYLLRTKGMDAANNFDGIYFSDMAQGENSHYTVTLFNWLLVPFTFISNLVVALKVVDVFIFSVSASIIYYTLKKMKVRYAFLAALFFISFEYITVRFFLGRAFVITTPLIFLEMYFAATKKYKSLAVVSLLHPMLHQATFFMPLLVVGCTELARYITQRRVSVKSFVYVGIAICVGMMFYPGFPGSMFGMFSTIGDIQSQNQYDGAAKSIGGTELKKIDVIEKFTLMKPLALFIIFDIIAVISLLIAQQRTKIEFKAFKKEQLLYAVTLFIFVSGFLFGSIFVSGRFFDFLIPSSVILFVLLMTMLFASKRIVMHKHILYATKITALIFFSIVFVNTVFVVRKNINFTESSHIKEIAEWIDERSDDGEVVFLYNWSDFTWMYFYNSNNSYTMGMEPENLRSYDEGLYWKYYNIFTHQYKCDHQKDCKNEIKNIRDKMKDLSKEKQELVQRSNGNGIMLSVKNDFHSRFIVTSSDSFRNLMLMNQNLIEDMLTVKPTNGGDAYTVFELK